MSATHLLERTSDGRYRVVRHHAIPSTLNIAGLSWRTALVRSGVGGKTILPDGDGTGGTIAAAEKTQILAGEVYEEEAIVKIPASLTGGQINTLLDEQYATANARVTSMTDPTSVRVRLNFYGHVRGNVT